jgi:hypothetical protein
MFGLEVSADIAMTALATIRVDMSHKCWYLGLMVIIGHRPSAISSIKSGERGEFQKTEFKLGDCQFQIPKSHLNGQSRYSCVSPLLPPTKPQLDAGSVVQGNFHII